MPIDWSSVHWLYVGILSVFAFVAALIGQVLAFGNRFFGAILAGVVFAALLVFWSYYPHGIGLPISIK
jgi:hypothetical protein